MPGWLIEELHKGNHLNAAGLSAAISFCGICAVRSSLHLWRTHRGSLKYFHFSCVFSFVEKLAAKGEFIFRFQISFFRGCIASGPWICLYAYTLHTYENHTQILILRTLYSIAYLDMFPWPGLSLLPLYNYTNIKLIKPSWIFLCFNCMDLLWSYQ